MKNITYATNLIVCLIVVFSSFPVIKFIFIIHFPSIFARGKLKKEEGKLKGKPKKVSLLPFFTLSIFHHFLYGREKKERRMGHSGFNGK